VKRVPPSTPDWRKHTKGVSSSARLGSRLFINPRSGKKAHAGRKCGRRALSVCREKHLRQSAGEAGRGPRPLTSGWCCTYSVLNPLQLSDVAIRTSASANQDLSPKARDLAFLFVSSANRRKSQERQR
jgi:hypothetical protein